MVASRVLALEPPLSFWLGANILIIIKITKRQHLKVLMTKSNNIIYIVGRKSRLT